jgi:dTDP-4-dehydrorhamnose 3,5-epimerase
MIFTETKLQGAFVVDLKPIEDERGFFARAWCQQECQEHGLTPDVKQVNLSYNIHKGTLRGMHCQIEPYGEAKMVRAIRGAVFDVIIDLRPDSPTYQEWIGVELSAQNHRLLYVPENFAHGFQTLTNDTEILYQVSQFYTPGAERGIRYDDPAFAIEWPLDVSVISEKDRTWTDFQEVFAVR